MTTPTPKGTKSQARPAARLAAVQALYQFDMEATRLVTLLDEFHRHRLGAEIEGLQFAEAEVAFFDDLVKGTLARRDEIDTLLSSKLAEGWRLERLDATLRATLRSATCGSGACGCPCGCGCACACACACACGCSCSFPANAGCVG